MSSHQEWQDEVVAQHDLEKPFAPENGVPLKFKIGDPVIFTNDYGVSFKRRVAGFYQPAEPCSLYACGHRYLLDSDSPWFPVKESQLQLDEDRANEAAVVTCPANARHEGDIVGCGSTNVTSGPDEEGFYDCLDCGLFFKAENDRRVAAE